MHPPPPGMPPPSIGEPSTSRMPPEVLAQKSHKWIQMQNKRYSEKRKSGFIDVGKQVCILGYFYNVLVIDIFFVGSPARACPQDHQGPR